VAAKNVRSKEPTRQASQPWPTVLAAVVAVLSLGLNGYQYLSNRDLTEATTAEAQRKVSVGIEIRYLVVTGTRIGLTTSELTTGGQQPPRVQENPVLQSLRKFGALVDVGKSPLVEKYGVVSAHGAVVLRIRNDGPATARSVVLTVRRKDFPKAGEDSSHRPWELPVSQWPRETKQLADLAPGQEVFVPLMHLVGSHRYLGTAYVPEQLAWLNETTGDAESRRVQSMAPEDQWITEGLDIHVAS